MLSPIEGNHNQLKLRQNLPRGYFKKRKPDRDPIPNYTFLRDVKWSSMLFAAVLFSLVTAASAINLATTIEPNLAVLSLEKPAISNTSIVVHEKLFNNITNGICGNTDIRYNIKNMRKLAGCRVVEGNVQILLIDEASEKDFLEHSFPELIEITGYLLLYRLHGIRSLQPLFPNLAVIRGKEVYNDYALVIYELMDLEEVGLINLQKIQRGSVRIEKNDKLCFAEMIEWSYIAENSDHYIAKNKENRYCAHCDKDLGCHKSKNDQRPLCWNQHHCQIKCSCSEQSCSKNGKCCDKTCVGGCDDNNPKQCKACKELSIYKNGVVTCADKCPPDKYEYLTRRCVSKEECIDFNKNVVIDPDRGIDLARSYIPYNTTCQLGCPQYYVPFEDKVLKKLNCRKCEGNECLKRCESRKIDSIASAHTLKGCAIINGPLEIQIRRTSKNIMRELETALSDVVEIRDYLKVARTFPLFSLSFLKKLQKIGGHRLESNKFAMVIWDNQNLQELWDPNQEVEIPLGQFYFHYNPKLCFSVIEKIAKNNSLIENYNGTKLSNGDKTQCDVQMLKVGAKSLTSSAVLLKWSSLNLDDERSLLGYVVYYTPAKSQNVTIWEGRDACGNDGWMLEDINDFVHKDEIAYPLTNLEPFTQYAFYVKAYTILTEQKGAQSLIQYIRTHAGQPSAVLNVDGVVKNSSMISLTWDPPRKINGKLSHYIVKIRMIEMSDENQRDYCLQPFEPFETAVAPYRIEHPSKNQNSIFGQSSIADIGGGLSSGNCDCKTCASTCKKPKEEDDERQSNIDFEDQIQDMVYQKRNEPVTTKDSRAKRQITMNATVDSEDDKHQPVKELNTVNEQGEYTQFVKELHNPTKLQIDLTNLRHYTSYLISVRACRELTEDDMPPRDDKENPDKENHDPCSIPTQVTVLTAKKDNADDIKLFDVMNVPSNETYGIVKVSWKAPENPNGLLLSYIIKYRKNEIENVNWESVCIPHQNYLNQTFYLLKPLSNGNYSIRISATSWAGAGNQTAIKNIIISENTGLPIWVYVLATSLVLLVICFSLFYYVRCHYMKSLQNMKLIANVNPDYAGVQYKLDNWEVPREKVKQMHELGQGSFGMVYEGVIKDLKIDGGETRCAIKTVNENATDKERTSFLNEASVMKQFDTAFVVRLLGVVSQSQPTMVIMELMINGDLKGYLRSHRPEYDNGSGTPPTPPTLRQILQMAAEIADGMSYLSAKKFVHRDLAARNCMVAEDMTVKIGDFGMTRDIYETDYYRKGTKGLLPVRWMSPESLKDGVFTSSSDVFSYGVVLWEISTLASQPYQGLSNDQVLRYVIEGGVMERPENCPDKLYELMRRCWQHRPSARPTFMDMIEQLLDDVNQNFRNVAFYFSKEAQDALYQLRQGEYAVNIQDDVTTPLRHGEEETSSIEGNHFLMDEMNNSSSQFNEL